MARNESGTVERITNFYDELEKFTYKVVRLEKRVPTAPVCTDVRNNSFAVGTNKSTTTPDNAELVFKRVRTRQSCPNRDKDTRNFSGIKLKACNNDSVGQICVERVYFAAGQGDIDPENSQGNLHKHPYENQSVNYNQLIETKKDRVSSESPKVDRRCGNEPSNLSPTNGFGLKIRPSKGGDPGLITTEKFKNIQGGISNCKEYNKHGKLNVVFGTGSKTDIQMTSGVPPKMECVYTATRNDSVGYIGPTVAVTSSAYDQGRGVRYQFERKMDPSCTQYIHKVSETDKNRCGCINVMCEGNRMIDSYNKRVTKNDPPTTNQPMHPEQITFNSRKLSLPIGDQHKDQVTQGIQSTYQVNGTPALQQQKNSHSKSDVVFHYYNAQSAGPRRQQRQNLNRKVMQYWLQTDQALRLQRTTAKQSDLHESRSSTSNNAAIIKPVAIRQKTDRLNLHSGQYSEQSYNGEVSIRTGNAKYSTLYPDMGLPAKMKNVAQGFDVNGKFQSFESNDQKTRINSSNKHNVGINRRFPSSQDIPSSSGTETVNSTKKIFGSQNPVHCMEMNEQRNCVFKSTKVDVNFQVTSPQLFVEKTSKSAQKVAKATQACLDIKSLVNPPFYQEQKFISEPSHLIQEADVYSIKNGAQDANFSKRKVENNESATNLKRKRPNSAPLEGN